MKYSMSGHMLHGHMLHGQMFMGQMLMVHMPQRQLTTHTDGLTIQPSKCFLVLTSNSGDMASYLLLNYRDPKNNKMNFAKPVVDIAASSRSWGSFGKLGLQSTLKCIKKKQSVALSCKLELARFSA